MATKNSMRITGKEERLVPAPQCVGGTISGDKSLFPTCDLIHQLLRWTSPSSLSVIWARVRSWVSGLVSHGEVGVIAKAWLTRSLISQRDHRIDLCRSACGDVTG